MNPGDIHRYDDIINLPRPEPSGQPRLTMENRAAQFSPFAALTGYDEATREEARLVDTKPEPSEDMMAMMEARLAVIGQHIGEQPEITVTCFLPDEKKAGGRCVTTSGRVKKLDRSARVMHLTDGTKIPLGNIRIIEGDLFRGFEPY